MRSHTRIEIQNGLCAHASIMHSSECLKGCVIFSHGFGVPGFESHRMFWEISNELYEHGYSSVLFDYRGSGYSDLDFSEISINTEIEDLLGVIDYVQNEIAPTNLYLWGQSFGSAIAAITAAGRQDLSGVILWCLSAELHDRYRIILGETIKDDGFVFTGAGLKVSKAFLDALKDKDVYRSIHEIKAPILFIHGDMDEKAPVLLSKTAFSNANEPKTLEVINGGNHGFKKQPFLFDAAKQKTYSWLESL